MANLLYLAGSVVLSSLVLAGLWLRNRKPQSFEAGIDSFQKELRALAPDRRSDREGRRSG
jgi:hypothetical protein